MAEPEPTESPHRRDTFAARLNRLFDVVRPAGRTRPYSNPEVARAISADGAEQISAQYLWALRNGSRDNPTLKQIESLARFFGVPPAYFLSDERASQIDQQLAMLEAARDADLREIMRRSTGLSETDRAAVLRILEGLAAARAEPGRKP